jgi:hypothetical protein
LHFWKEEDMSRKLALGVLLAVFAMSAVGQGDSGNTAYLRVLQLANDATSVSVTLPTGQTILTNLASGTMSDYVSFEVERSIFATLTITPRGGLSAAREWSVPPLAAGHYTAVIVGNSTDNTLQMTLVDEDRLCEGKLESGSCVILVNDIKDSPPLNLITDTATIIDAANYRQTVVNHAPARSYRNLTAVDANNSDTVLFRLPRWFFEPNVIYFYSLIGRYSGGTLSNFSLGTLRRVPVDSMTFLRGFTADLQLTDGTTLFATENIVAILEASGFAELLESTSLLLTVLAPTDGAVLDTSVDLYTCAISSPAAMRALILNHVFVGSYTPSQLINAAQLPTMAGTIHTFTDADGGFLIDNTVRVDNALSYPTLNGNVYLIDTVLVPDDFADRYCTQG